MVEKKGLPHELVELLKQLVMNGSVRIAGIVLHAYCRRFYQVDEETAARWMIAYFRREYPQQWQKQCSRTHRA